MRLVALLIVIVLIAGVSAFMFTKRAKSPNTTSPATSDIEKAKEAALLASSTVITMNNSAFAPTSLTVKAGTEVTFENDDSVAHTITADDGSFDSGNITPGESYKRTFGSAGTVNYHCTIHSNMKGKIIVQ